MTEQVQAKIREYSLLSPDEESCGIVINVKNELVVTHARNIAQNKRDIFILHQDDWLEAEAMGEIAYIWHSHPNSPATPTMADTAACNRLGIPWIIYSLPSDTFCEVKPAEDEPELLGREFSWGVFDCGTLVADYYKQVLDIGSVVEPYPEDFDKDPEAKPYRQKFVDNGFVEVGSDDLREHDVLLMQIGSSVPNHAAIYLGNDLILHHLLGKLSRRDVYGHYFQKATRHVMRHKSRM